jgi:hypothetical protein
MENRGCSWPTSQRGVFVLDETTARRQPGIRDDHLPNSPGVTFAPFNILAVPGGGDRPTPSRAGGDDDV